MWGIYLSTYNFTGRLKRNLRGPKAELNTEYAYNIRSWTKSMETRHGDTFLYSLGLYYNDAVRHHQYPDYQTAYNGNISGMEWKLQGEEQRSCRFKYDALSRLTHSAYNGVVYAGAYNTTYSYDKHGNMLNMVQRGLSSTVDNLQMSYTGNQLRNVHNIGTGLWTSTSAHFQDYSKDPGKSRQEYSSIATGLQKIKVELFLSYTYKSYLKLSRQKLANFTNKKRR